MVSLMNMSRKHSRRMRQEEEDYEVDFDIAFKQFRGNQRYLEISGKHKSKVQSRGLG